MQRVQEEAESVQGMAQIILRVEPMQRRQARQRRK